MPTSIAPALALVCAATLLATGAATARAEGVGDGAYGRLDRDLWLTVGALGGPRFADGGTDGSFEVAFRARYLDAAGVVVAASHLPGPSATRLFVGLEARPLFPARFLMNLSSGDPWLDLFVDSIGVELGVMLGPWGSDAGDGAAFAWGLGIELPLVLPTTWPGAGLHLRIAMRRVRGRSGDVGGPQDGVDDWTLLSGLVLRGSVRAGIAAGAR